MHDLTQPAIAPLDNCTSLQDMARAEGGYSADLYALALSDHIRDSSIPVSRQRERLLQLARVGLAGSQASAEALTQHYAIVEALGQRFAAAAVKLLGEGRSVQAETYMNLSLKATRAALEVLSAIKILREEQSALVPPTSGPTPSPTDQQESGSVPPTAPAGHI